MRKRGNVCPKYKKADYKMEKLYKTLAKWILGILYYSVRNQHHKEGRFKKVRQNEDKIFVFYEKLYNEGII